MPWERQRRYEKDGGWAQDKENSPGPLTCMTGSGFGVLVSHSTTCKKNKTENRTMPLAPMELFCTWLNCHSLPLTWPGLSFLKGTVVFVFNKQ